MLPNDIISLLSEFCSDADIRRHRFIFYKTNRYKKILSEARKTYKKEKEKWQYLPPKEQIEYYLLARPRLPGIR